MSYARDPAAIKANEKAYAKYRDTIGSYAVTSYEADQGAIDDLKSATKYDSGQRIGGFNQSGHIMGSGADEINYRINKSGTFTMKDVKDIDTFGGRADDGGVLVRKNASDLKVGGGKGGGIWRSIDDMINNSDGRAETNYKFDQDVIDYTAKMRAADDRRQAAEKAARRRRNPNNKDGVRANNDVTSSSAITQGPDNSAAQAQQREQERLALIRQQEERAAAERERKEKRRMRMERRKSKRDRERKGEAGQFRSQQDERKRKRNEGLSRARSRFSRRRSSK